MSQAFSKGEKRDMGMDCVGKEESMKESIHVENAHVHNLKGVTLDIPKNRIVVFTGVSGSGKTSLLFDTVHREAERQLIETFSSFARRRLPKLSRPEVDSIRNLPPSIVIDQKRMGRTLRSTVGTATEVYTYLRMLFSRCGSVPGLLSSHFSFNHPEGMCPACKGLGRRISIDPNLLLDRRKSLKEGAVLHPDYRIGGWNWRELLGSELFDNDTPLEKFADQELNTLLYARSLPIIKKHGAGTYSKVWEGVVQKLERLYINRDSEELPRERRESCLRFLVYEECSQCQGRRLNKVALSSRVQGYGIGDVVERELVELDAWLATVRGEVAEPLVRKMRGILSHLIGIGVGYLSLNRCVSTLSGGESQRVKMARQLDCDLTGLMYVLDEPTIGLHPRDVEQLITILRGLVAYGNSVFVVEHDETLIAAADHVIEVGPGAGRFGGEICFNGSIEEYIDSGSKTVATLRKEQEGKPIHRRKWTEAWQIENATLHNLKGITVQMPKGVLVCVTGVAGSGKSSLVHGVFAKQHGDVVVADQNPITGNSRSNPATFLGIFDQIRKTFAHATGESPSLFSFNSSGACSACKGAGVLSVEMSFLDDVRILCPKCGGKRFSDKVLSLLWNGRSIYDLLSMTVEEAMPLFSEARTKKALEMLGKVGLSYLTLGQPLSTLSGGESQRLKLAAELGKKGGVYILDEPTTGLHREDIQKLMLVLHSLVDDGNSVIIIEHNLDVISQGDWVIDLGPEGGRFGGNVVAFGPPERIAQIRESHTGRFLAKSFGWGA